MLDFFFLTCQAEFFFFTGRGTAFSIGIFFPDLSPTPISSRTGDTFFLLPIPNVRTAEACFLNRQGTSHGFIFALINTQNSREKNERARGNGVNKRTQG
jgi:hypothetical protein